MKDLTKEIIYELYPLSFCDGNGDGYGDFLGIISKLDYLKELGITVIWLTPIYPSDFVDGGYDVKDYYNVNPLLGTLETFKLLLKEATDRGIKIILDFVSNHTSSEHLWFKKAISKRHHPYQKYYIFRDNTPENRPPSNWNSTAVGGSTWEYIEEIDQYYFHLYSPEQPDLDWSKPEVRDEIYSILRFWLDLGVSGFRFDVINKIAKNMEFPDVEQSENGLFIAEEHYLNQEPLFDYIKEMNLEVFSDYPEAITIGQISGSDFRTAKRYTDKSGLDLFLQFEHLDADRLPFLKTKEIGTNDFINLILKWQLSGLNLPNTLFFGSHDLARSVNKYGSSRYHYESATMLHSVLLTLKGTPIIYMGDEFGTENAFYNSLEEYVDVRSVAAYKHRLQLGESKEELLKSISQMARDNARFPLAWTSSDYGDVPPYIQQSTLKDSRNLEQDILSDRSIYRFIQKVIAFRAGEIEMIKQNIEASSIKIEGVMIFHRRIDSRTYTFMANFEGKNKPLDGFKKADIVLNNYHEFNGQLEPYHFIIFREVESKSRGYNGNE